MKLRQLLYVVLLLALIGFLASSTHATADNRVQRGSPLTGSFARLYVTFIEILNCYDP